LPLPRILPGEPKWTPPRSVQPGHLHAHRDLHHASSLDFLLADFENAHHPLILMIQDVAVKHPFAGMIVIPNDESHSLVARHVDRVLPAEERLRYAIPVDYLELE